MAFVSTRMFIPTQNVLPDETSAVEFLIDRSDVVQRGLYSAGHFRTANHEYGWQRVQCWRYRGAPAESMSASADRNSG